MFAEKEHIRIHLSAASSVHMSKLCLLKRIQCNTFIKIAVAANAMAVQGQHRDLLQQRSDVPPCFITVHITSAGCGPIANAFTT